jgi:hypothetical protein
VVKTTSAGPSGGAVTPGQTITVTVRWKSGDDFSEEGLFLTEDCVEIGSRISTTLSRVHVPAPHGRTDTFSYVVPGDTGGQPICDRAVLVRHFDPETENSGQGGESSRDEGGDDPGDNGDGRHDPHVKSAVLCYSVLAAATPESPSALFLPAAGLLVLGGVLLAVRRRRRTPFSDGA